MTERNEGAYAATRVRMEREKRGWTLDITAEKLRAKGIPKASASMVNKIEMGHRAISLEELAAFSDIYQLPITDILIPPERLLRDIYRRYSDAFQDFVDAFERFAAVVVDADKVLGNVGGERLRDDVPFLLTPFNDLSGQFNDKVQRALTIAEKKS